MKISRTPTATAHPTWMTLTLEVAGGLFSWSLDDGLDVAPQLHVWDPPGAAWLWRIVGERGHVEALAALTEGSEVDIRVDNATGAAELALLRRLAWGHWLRRWWPTSVADGIEPLSAVVLDVEVALLTGDCDAYFDQDSFDGDPQALLVGHDDDEIDALAKHFSPDVRALHRRWLSRDTEVAGSLDVSMSGTADDYALAAGPTSSIASSDGIARGRASLPWESVPANTFDAAEDTIAWWVDAAPDVVAEIAVALLPGRTAVPLRIELSLPDPPVHAQAILDAAGTARILLPLTAAQAWSADWSALLCTVGTAHAADARELRDQVRTLLHRRISGFDDGVPLYVAEQLIADADY